MGRAFFTLILIEKMISRFINKEKNVSCSPSQDLEADTRGMVYLKPTRNKAKNRDVWIASLGDTRGVS